MLILPIIERFYEIFTSGLPVDLWDYDLYGNSLRDPNEILREDSLCIRMNNFTEKFREFADNLYVKRGTISESGWNDSKEFFQYPIDMKLKLDDVEINRFYKESDMKIQNNLDYDRGIKHNQFTDIEIEESASYWESKMYHNDYEISVDLMPKTFQTFPFINVPKRSRFARSLESYLIDLSKLFYPFLDGSKLSSFEDFLALILFHLYVHLREEPHGQLYREYVKEVLKDLNEMGTVLKLPKKLKRINCLRSLFFDVLKFDCILTFRMFLKSNVLNLNCSQLIKKVLSCKKRDLIKVLFKSLDRNMEIKDIGREYHGRLCHAIYWSFLKSDSEDMIGELLKYYDVNWDEPDCRGFSVLGYFIHEKIVTERFKLFLESTTNFISCFKSNETERNVLEECLSFKNESKGFEKFVAFLNIRRQDDFSRLLITAALNKRKDYFERILQYRVCDCAHELEAAFQQIYQYLRMEETYLFSYLNRLVIWIHMWHGARGRKLEHVFLMKWEIQLAKWRATADEFGIEIKS